MRSSFATLPADPATHFRFATVGLVLDLLERHPDLLAAIPQLEGYRAEAARLLGTSAPAAAGFAAALAGFAAPHPALPLVRIAAVLPSPEAIRVLVALAMVEEDPLLGLVFEPEGGPPTIGGLTAMLRSNADPAAALAVRAAIADLEAAGLVRPATADVPRALQPLRVLPPVLDLLLGLPMAGSGLLPAHALPDPSAWIAPTPGTPGPEAVAAALAKGMARLLLVRGPSGNGRRCFVAMAARAAGLGLLLVEDAVLADPQRLRAAQGQALAAGAMLLVRLPPGVTTAPPLAPHPFRAVSTAIVGPPEAGAAPAPGQSLLTVDLPLPDARARRRHWRAAGAPGLAGACATMALASGAIHRVAASARATAALAGRSRPRPADARAALCAMAEARLAGLAARASRTGPPEPLFLDPETGQALDHLATRIRLREPFAASVPGSTGRRGVAALFVGPSGAGKTLAARHLAHRLGKDLFRLDLAATVSKYIGETEKNLERALAAAEELDILLLLDEGDALLATRTDIGTAHDRYANLETSYLLQRLERFEGVLLVTSNEAGRIDRAFTRRFDARISFRAADAVQRAAILESLLGPHRVTPALIDEIASRCPLAGGELRLVAQWARLAALAAGTEVGDETLRAAVATAYRQKNSDSPLRSALSVVAG